MELNVTAIRKILKKFDKKFKSVPEVPDAQNFLQRCLKEENHHPFMHLVNNDIVLKARDTLEECLNKDLKPIILQKQ